MKMTIASAAPRVNSPDREQGSPDQLGAADERPPKHAGLVAEAVEQLRIGGQSHAAESAEQFLQAVRNENSAGHDAQQRRRILIERIVNLAERRDMAPRLRSLRHLFPPCLPIACCRREIDQLIRAGRCGANDPPARQWAV
jgi:hypothetical protein